MLWLDLVGGEDARFHIFHILPAAAGMVILGSQLGRLVVSDALPGGHHLRR